MDDLDVRIIRAMGIRPYERTPKDPEALKPGRLAEIVGVTPETVKARLARMEASGVIVGDRTVPNLRHLGLFGEAHYFPFPADEEKDANLPKLAGVEGVLEIHDFLGKGLCVDFAARSAEERDAKLAVIAETLGEPGPLKFYDREMPPFAGSSRRSTGPSCGPCGRTPGGPSTRWPETSGSRAAPSGAGTRGWRARGASSPSPW